MNSTEKRPAAGDCILGVSAFYHDSAASLVRGGCIEAAAQEERFTRKKHDPGFPAEAVRFCLRQGGVSSRELLAVAFYDKPWAKFDRLLENYLATAPRGLRSFTMAMPIWIKEKLWMRRVIDSALGSYEGELIFCRHHESHAASAFFPSPFDEAAVLTLDGVGEWHTTTWGTGRGAKLELCGKIDYPHSLGLLYSAFTYYTGFRVNSGEYKVMGLAPYGEPRYLKTILDELIDVKEDGSYRLNMEYFGYMDGLTMTNGRFDRLFGGPPRKPESPLTGREMDLARSVQEAVNLILIRMARHIRKETGQRNLCLAGGVALNCVANGLLQRERVFDDLWIQPAAGDAGGAIGAALFAWHELYGMPRKAGGRRDSQKASRIGPAYGGDEIEAQIKQFGAVFHKMRREEIPDVVAGMIADGKVVGWVQGRMEFGPRALGGRSIIGDPRSPKMQATMNLKIKFRESFRPFAPTVLAENAKDFFDMEGESPYMLLVFPVREGRRRAMSAEEEKLFGIDKLNVPRSDVPAITHVDYSARVQTVRREDAPEYYDMIAAFGRKTGFPIIINTSFNVRGEPIVCAPADAYRCFMRTEMDALVIEEYVLSKVEQPPWKEDRDWRREFALD